MFVEDISCSRSGSSRIPLAAQLLLYVLEELLLRRNLLAHFVSHLFGIFCQLTLVVAGLVIEDDPDCPNSVTCLIEKRKLILEVIACLVHLEIAFAGIDDAHVILISLLADAAYVGGNDHVL